MLLDDIERALVSQGVSKEEVRFHVDQMVQGMTIFESNPNMFSVQFHVCWMETQEEKLDSR